ncbi:MAG: alpha/beta hydrolase [Hyphomonadaceae bacterium]|nr:alpha/beta hydrolase [Hyphomonadaceae bacterium]
MTEPAQTEAAPAENFRRVSYEVPGGAMAGIAFGAETPTPDIVFLHATGFNARTYRTLLAPLGEKYHVLALDARGHGRTQLKARIFGYTSWRRHRNDLIALLERHFTKPVTLAGHSMGATVSLLTAGRRPDLVSSLALFEPVILPAAAYAFSELPFAPALNRGFMPLAHGALHRRRRFPSRAAAVQAFTGRGVFKSFTPDMIEDYVADGFVDTPSGAVKLACHPRYEAATFCAQRNHPWSALEAGSGPLVLLRAEHHSTLSAAAMQKIAALRPSARVATVEGSTHMLPMERPDRVRAAIEAAMLMAGRSFTEVD